MATSDSISETTRARDGVSFRRAAARRQRSAFVGAQPFRARERIHGARRRGGVAVGVQAQIDERQAQIDSVQRQIGFRRARGFAQGIDLRFQIVEARRDLRGGFARGVDFGGVFVGGAAGAGAGGLRRARGFDSQILRLAPRGGGGEKARPRSS